MIISTILFLNGILFSTFFPSLPSLSLIFKITILLISCFILNNKIINYAAIFSLGILWAFFRAHLITLWTLPHAIENQPIIILGYIDSIPTIQTNFTTFNFHMLRILNKKCSAKIHLTWPHCNYKLQVGDYWRLQVKLKQPHSLTNPGSFDLEKIYFQNHLRALGSVQNAKTNQLLSSLFRNYPIQRVRQYLYNEIVSKLNNSEFKGILLALTLGITSNMSQVQWQVFRATGAISGLHIGLVAGMCSKLAGIVWRRIPYAVLIAPIPIITPIFGLFAAIIYSVLAGLSVSTQRSLIMIMAVTLAKFLYRDITTFRSLIMALVIILIINPLAILTTGFWLSFIAVTLLVYGMNHRLTQEGLWWQWGRAQWVVSLGMIPCVVAFFQQVSMLSIPANIVAIPWISFLVVPCCLLGILFIPFIPKLGTSLLFLSENLLHIIWLFLKYLASFSGFIWHFAFPNYCINLISYIAALMVLLPTGLMHRILSLFWSLPLFFYTPSKLHLKKVELTVFDVGQGLATMVQTRNHTLIYDTGARLNENFDMGNAVIVPYLLQNRINKVDVMVISHGDNDHIGGAHSVLQALPTSLIITSVPNKFKNNKVLLCTKGIGWNWDGVAFKFIYPEGNIKLKGNNSSCVLKVSTGSKSILFTGDIENKAELVLLNQAKKELAATVLIVPHHGSKTSSSFEFVKAVGAKYNIFSYGYCNMYHHPNIAVVKRYEATGGIILNTVLSGAITMTLSPDSDIVAVTEYRKQFQKYWYLK